MEERKYLYWAIQTSQPTEPTEQELELFQIKYKEDYEQDVVFQGEELLNKFRLNSWRNPIWSRIISIILAFEHNGEMRVKYIKGVEKDLLQNFTNLLRNNFQDYNLVNFDSEILLPFLGVRLHKNEFINSPHADLKYQGNTRSWNFSGVDLKAFYKGGGKYSLSLKEMAYVLNINSDNIINYRDEFTYVNSGNQEALKVSAIKQVEVIAQIWRKLNGLPKLETILVEEQVKDVEELEQPILAKLYQTKQFNQEVKDYIKSLNLLTVEDKENTIKILLANYQQKGDKIAVKRAKEQDVKNFINTL